MHSSKGCIISLVAVICNCCRLFTAIYRLTSKRRRMKWLYVISVIAKKHCLRSAMASGLGFRDAGYGMGLPRECKLEIGKNPQVFSPKVLFWPQEAPKGETHFRVVLVPPGMLRVCIQGQQP